MVSIGLSMPCLLLLYQNLFICYSRMKFHNSNLKRTLKNLFYPRKKDVVVLEPHLGLGDGIICLGLVRELSKRSPNIKFYYVCLHRCYHTLSWMFADLDNVYLFAVYSGREARQLTGFLNAQYLPIGIENVDVKQFDAFFYRQHGISFERRWDNAVVAPGLMSDILFEKLNPNHQPYILVCNRESGLVSYPLKINNPKNKKIIELDALTNNIYDWTRITLEADEIHTIDTSFVHFVESLLYQRPAPSLYYHVVRKTIGEYTRRLPWRVVSY